MSLQRWAYAVSAPVVHRLWAWMRWAGAIGPQHAAGRRFGHLGDGAIITFPPGDHAGQEHISIGSLTTERVHVEALWEAMRRHAGS